MSRRGPIVAIATSTATDAALAILRMSGENCHQILSTCLRQKGRPLDISKLEERRVLLCEFVEPRTSHLLDIVTVIFYVSPRSYTGEDAVELICHGGRGLTRRIHDQLVEVGFSPSAPGDFTRRAFLNGKLDLPQAEAVAAATSAVSALAARAAAKGLSGETSSRILSTAQQLLELLSLLESNLDLSEEGIDVAPPERIMNVLRSTDAFLSELLRHAARANLLTGALRVTFAGKPNVGKSTLFNRLLGSERAIVTPEPGTTRDVLEGRMELGGILFDFLDTAGIRDSDNFIESEGIRRARNMAETSDLILFVLDATRIAHEDEVCAASLPADTPRIIVLNKTDLAMPEARALQPFQKNGFADLPVIRTVGVSEDGIVSLRSALVEQGRLLMGEMADAPVWISARQSVSLHKAHVAVQRALTAAAEMNLTEEFLSADIREALDALAEFAGTKTADDVLDRIFAQFCVGK